MNMNMYQKRIEEAQERLIRLEKQLEILQLQLESLKPKNKVIKLFDEE